MVVLTEQIEIPASYEKLKAWTASTLRRVCEMESLPSECNLYNRNYHAEVRSASAKRLLWG